MKKHIMLIDDDKDELVIFMDALNPIMGDFKCTYADNAEQAYEMLKYLEPDVIFVDYNLPPLNGLQLLAVIRGKRKFRKSKVYLYSTTISDEVNKMARTLGAAGCIEKTNKISTLTHELKAILNPELLPSYVFFGGNNSVR
jgi:DNA-binding response OmpR family regulator